MKTLSCSSPSAATGPARADRCGEGHLCPVREAYLRYALATGQGFRLWVGLTEDERRGMRYQEQPSEPPAEPERRSQAPPPAPRARPRPTDRASAARHGRMSASHTGRREPPPWGAPPCGWRPMTKGGHDEHACRLSGGCPRTRAHDIDGGIAAFPRGAGRPAAACTRDPRAAPPYLPGRGDLVPLLYRADPGLAAPEYVMVREHAQI